MKKFFLVLILFLGIAFLVASFGELETILNTLLKARMEYFALALLLQTLWFFTSARMYKSVFRVLGMDESLWELTVISTAANFVNIVTASRGMGGVALFAKEARKRGHPAGKATVAAALFLSLDQASFLVILALGLLILFLRHDLDWSEILASGFMFAVTAGYAFVLYVGYRSETRLGALLAKLARWINRVMNFFRYRGEYIHESRAYEFAHEVAEGFSHLRKNPANMARPVVWGIFDKILLMLILICAFLSFNVPFRADVIVAGFSIAFLFLTVSPTPYGVGIVEGFMPVVLASLKVNWNDAVVITLAYRAVTFWFPLAVGAWAFRALHADET